MTAFDSQQRYLDVVFRGSAWPMAITVTIAAPLGEEVFFRGIILGVLLRAGRKYIPIFAVSAIFAAVHFFKAPQRTSTQLMGCPAIT